MPGKAMHREKPARFVFLGFPFRNPRNRKTTYHQAAALPKTNAYRRNTGIRNVNGTMILARHYLKRRTNNQSCQRHPHEAR